MDRGHGANVELAIVGSIGNGAEDRSALGAVCESVRGVLNVAARVDLARTGEDGCADKELAERRVGTFARLLRGGDQFVLLVFGDHSCPLLLLLQYGGCNYFRLR